MTSRNFRVASPEVISSRQGWLLHHDAVFCAAARMRSMVARGTGCGWNARQEKREARRSSRTSTGSCCCIVARELMKSLYVRPRDAGMTASPPPGRDLVERHVLVDPDVSGQAQHALGDDVAQDLVGAAGDP